MLDVGWSEILVIAVVMIVVVGPKDLPKMLRAFGKATARMRTTANEFKRQFDDALKEAELDDVKNLIDETRKLDPRSKMTQVFDPIRSAGNDLKASLNQTPKPEQTVKPVDPSIYKDNKDETGVAVTSEAVAEAAAVQTPSAAIAEAVKKNLPEEQVAETAKPAVAKPAAKAKSVDKTPAAKTPASKTTAKSAARPAAAKAPTDEKAAAPKKPAAKKTPAKKPAAKTTGTNE